MAVLGSKEGQIENEMNQKPTYHHSMQRNKLDIAFQVEVFSMKISICYFARINLYVLRGNRG